MAIVSFGDKRTEELFNGVASKKTRSFPSELHAIARRKLDMLNAAAVLSDLRSPPGNNLHDLKEEMKGYHAIRINDQWRVVFVWTLAGPKNVEIRDYH